MRIGDESQDAHCPPPPTRSGRRRGERMGHSRATGPPAQLMYPISLLARVTALVSDTTREPGEVPPPAIPDDRVHPTIYHLLGRHRRTPKIGGMSHRTATAIRPPERSPLSRPPYDACPQSMLSFLVRVGGPVASSVMSLAVFAIRRYCVLFRATTFALGSGPAKLIPVLTCLW